MKREGTIGLGAVLAVVAAVGISLQGGPKEQVSRGGAQSSLARRLETVAKKFGTPAKTPGCSNLENQLKVFLNVKELTLPDSCYESDHVPGALHPPQKADTDITLKFVVAILPDPVHTHFSALFDQFTMAVQDGAQDEKYDFDSSWLPWESEEDPYALLADQKAASTEKDWKERQPGIILFRKTLADDSCKKREAAKLPEKQQECLQDQKIPEGNNSRKTPLQESYRSGLVVFVVGDEATNGIHREQFRNALAWIRALQPDDRMRRVGILGQTGLVLKFHSTAFSRATTRSSNAFAAI